MYVYPKKPKSFQSRLEQWTVVIQLHFMTSYWQSAVIKQTNKWRLMWGRDFFNIHPNVQQDML